MQTKMVIQYVHICTVIRIMKSFLRDLLCLASHMGKHEFPAVLLEILSVACACMYD